jgi:hypothetical protein
MVESDMTDREILDRRIKNLKKLRGLYLFGAIFFLHLVPFISVMTIYSLWDFDEFYADMPNPIASFLLLLLFIFMLLFFGIWFAKFARLYIRLIKILEKADPLESETKKFVCDKYRVILRNRFKYSLYKVGVIVFTGGEKYYYIFARESYDIAHIPLGEHEVELYKGTNIIKKFDAADDAQSEFTIWG